MINEEVSDKTLNLEIKAAKITAKLIIQQIKKLLLVILHKTMAEQ